MSTVSPKRAHADREQLVESHLPLVQSVARRYASSGESLDDLVQVGAVGLVKASNRFDPRRGVAFAAFAAPVIEGEIRHHLRDRCAPVRIPRSLQRTSGALRRKRDQLTAATGHSPSTRELAVALNLDEEGVERALRVELARAALPLSPEDESRPEDSEDSTGSEDRVSLAKCMRVLDERQRKIVFLRFHADMTERQIGSELGISQTQVSRLLHSALTRLRRELAGPASAASTADSSAHHVISPARGAEHATSRARGADSTADDTRNGARSAFHERERAVNISAVPASQAARTVAEYLDLPYSVAVHADREGDQSRWTATVEELAGCSAQGRTPDEAVELLRGAMQSWLEAAVAQRREIPLPGQGAKPKATSSHSGRFLVRMPATLHTQLAEAAEDEHLSLNRFITQVLTASVSPAAIQQQQPAAPEPEASAAGTRRASLGPSRALRIAMTINIVVVVLAASAAGVLLVLALQRGI
jgi:RNA polymerase sigma-B factor